MRVLVRLGCLGAGLALATCAAVIPGTDSSTAAFTDAEHAAVQVQAAELATPAGNDCQLSPLPPLAATSATLRWRAPSPAPASYGYEWRRLNSSGAVVTSGTYPATTTEHRIGASTIGIATTQTFQVRVVEGQWYSPWRSARLTTLISVAGIALIGSCSWQ